MDWEKEAKYWREKYIRQYHSWLTLRETYNKLLRNVDCHEIRLILATKANNAKNLTKSENNA